MALPYSDPLLPYKNSYSTRKDQNLGKLANSAVLLHRSSRPPNHAHGCPVSMASNMAAPSSTSTPAAKGLISVSSKGVIEISSGKRKRKDDFAADHSSPGAALKRKHKDPQASVKRKEPSHSSNVTSALTAKEEVQESTWLQVRLSLAL